MSLIFAPAGGSGTLFFRPAATSAPAPLRILGLENEIANSAASIPFFSDVNHKRHLSRFKVTTGSGAAESIALVWSRRYRQGAVETFPKGDTTIIDAAIEDGTTGAQITFGGSNTKLIHAGDYDVVSDRIPASAFGLSSFPKGFSFWIKIIEEYTPEAGDFEICVNSGYSSGAAEQGVVYDPATSSATPAVAPGGFNVTGSYTGVGVGFKPWVVGAFSDGLDPLTAGGLVDSIIAHGQNDSQGGYMRRAAAGVNGGPIAYLNLARDGGDLTHITSDHALTFSGFKYARVWCEESGSNDLIYSGLATHQTNTQAVWTAMRAAGVEKIIRPPVLPRTNSSDNWTTAIGQSYQVSQWGPAGIVDQYNAWIQTKLADGTLDSIPSFAAVLDATTPQKWKTDGSTGQLSTTDGTHPTPAASALMAIPVTAFLNGLPFNSGALGGYRLGVNLAGMEFQSSVLPGTPNVTYAVMGRSSFDYWNFNRVRVFRLPILWTRVQPVSLGALDSTYWPLVLQAIALAAARGQSVILDIHQFGYGPDGAVGGATTNAALLNLWTRIDAATASLPGIEGFDLMNEPVGAVNWNATAQYVVNGLRTAGCTRKLYIEGAGYSTAGTWTSVNNGFTITDPGDNFAISAHLYGDRDSSGTFYDWTTEASHGVTVNTLADRAQVFLDWCATKGYAAHFGEVGVPDNDSRWLTMLGNFLALAQAHNAEVTLWAGGPFWGDGYPLSVDKRSNGSDAPQLATMLAHASDTSVAYPIYPPTATILAGPSTVVLGQTYTFTLRTDELPLSGTPIPFTISDYGFTDGVLTGGVGTLTHAAPVATITYVAASTGTKVFSTFNSGGLTNSSNLQFEVLAATSAPTIRILLPAAAGGTTGALVAVYSKLASGRLGALLFNVTSGLTIPAAVSGTVTLDVTGTGSLTSGQTVSVCVVSGIRGSSLFDGRVL